jgi:hypothetical protein
MVTIFIAGGDNRVRSDRDYVALRIDPGIGMSGMQFADSLVRDLAWPATVLVIAVIFRSQFRVMMGNLADRMKFLRKIQTPAGSAEFQDQLDNVQRDIGPIVIEEFPIFRHDPILANQNHPATKTTVRNPPGDTEVPPDPNPALDGIKANHNATAKPVRLPTGEDGDSDSPPTAVQDETLTSAKSSGPISYSQWQAILKRRQPVFYRSLDDSRLHNEILRRHFLESAAMDSFAIARAEEIPRDLRASYASVIDAWKRLESTLLMLAAELGVELKPDQTVLWTAIAAISQLNQGGVLTLAQATSAQSAIARLQSMYTAVALGTEPISERQAAEYVDSALQMHDVLAAAERLLMAQQSESNDPS